MSTQVFNTRHTQLLRNKAIHDCKSDAIAALNNHIVNPAITMRDGELVASRYWAFFEYVNVQTESENPKHITHESYDNGGWRLRELPNGTVIDQAPSTQYQVLPSMPTLYTKGVKYEEGALVYYGDKFYEAGDSPSSTTDTPTTGWSKKVDDMPKKFACVRTLVGVVTLYLENGKPQLQRLLQGTVKNIYMLSAKTTL